MVVGRWELMHSLLKLKTRHSAFSTQHFEGILRRVTLSPDVEHAARNRRLYVLAIVVQAVVVTLLWILGRVFGQAHASP